MRLDFNEVHDFWYIDRPYPVVPIRLSNGRHIFNTFALLDTGADTCLFHSNLAEAIGLRLEAGRREMRGGIDPTTRIECYSHKIGLAIGDNRTLRCEVAFSRDVSDEVIEQLIGREVIFDRMRFAFRQRLDKIYVGRKP